jgi:hypothetical protein
MMTGTLVLFVALLSSTVSNADEIVHLACNVASSAKWPGYRGTVMELELNLTQRTVKESQTFMDAAVNPPRTIHIGNSQFGTGTLNTVTNGVIAGSLNEEGDQFTLNRFAGRLTFNNNGSPHPLSWACQGG